MWISDPGHPCWRWWWMAVVVVMTLQVITPIYSQECRRKYTVRASINICGELIMCAYDWKCGNAVRMMSTLQLPGEDVMTVTPRNEVWNRVTISNTDTKNMIDNLSTKNITLKIPELGISEGIHCLEKYQPIIITSNEECVWSYGLDSSKCASRINVITTIRMCGNDVKYDLYLSPWDREMTLMLPDVKMININTPERGEHYRVEVVKQNNGPYPAHTNNYKLIIQQLGVSENLQCWENNIAEVIITNKMITWNCLPNSSGNLWIYLVAAGAFVMTAVLLSFFAFRRIQGQKTRVGDTPPVTCPHLTNIKVDPSRPVHESELPGTPQLPMTPATATPHNAGLDNSCSDPAEHIYEEIDAYTNLGRQRSSHDSENSIYGLQATCAETNENCLELSQKL